MQPTTPSVTFRPEGDGDESFLRLLYASTRVDELAATGWTADQSDAFLRMQFDFQRAHYRRHYAGADFLIVLLDGQPIGRFYVHRSEQDIRLMDIALLPDCRGRGIGGAIIGGLLADGAARGVPVSLHVEPRSRAVALYTRLGFAAVSENETNLFMQWGPEAGTAQA